MMNGRNNGKKLMAVRIVAHAFEIVGHSPINAYWLGISDQLLIHLPTDPYHDRPEPHPNCR